jgi:hypothetical protein
MQKIEIYETAFYNLKREFGDMSVTEACPPTVRKSLSERLGAEFSLDKTTELNLTKPVSLDGLTTLELVYL